MSDPSGRRATKLRSKQGADLRVIDSELGGNPDIIDILLTALQKARRGELSALALVTVAPDGTVGTCWEEGDLGQFHHISSGALTLNYRLGGQK